MNTRRPASLVNGLAWGIVLGLAIAAICLVLRIGPFGLVLLGLLTVFVCSQFSLDDAAPTWGTEVFRARMARQTSPEQRAADIAERKAALSPLRFYHWCGVLLVVAGGATLVWQYLNQS
jgi:hypothetical protein